MLEFQMGNYLKKETINKLNRTFALESEQTKGTRIIITIPNQII
jgi:sensor histidine kinase regulating citrate/malate metabolism